MLQRLLTSSANTALSRGRILATSRSRPLPESKSTHRNLRPSTIDSNGSRQIRWHGDGPGPDAPTVDLTFVNPDDSHTTISARVGETLLQTAHRTGIEMEGACEGVCACSTCHIILEQETYDELLDELEDGALSEDEEDMLDMAFGLTHTSRLGCQITVKENMGGSKFTLPKATRNFYVDGHKPTPH
mmetsp:Transcript_50697/g.108028  ORF Transcript_50697/g.108028 Transcript_50697/m.108028 type:complete len:187 (+) Transcript_50697:151-711(+)|eukprot:CAMPEP_0172541792 /NCGR_PEP_ID=MMETSP1067-20121228/12557_1 /TAXON_ID=265564 ORGANISM="Thalassiosira punctigera, Strain Tpunct2005C2" /NCGR_SAMPLE_ID=MMETSP1067 /ASSEMBLY_ACC=CAM_ASM_000444 /LENGTH=186 /DNA_ID=CAMNT_0013327909 /DNA_START=137 /DNA_END=697 /DNA_ORIENTATION=-